MAKKSAGIVLYRYRSNILEVFLVHPGGPYWAKKDEGAWSIPKGEYDEGEDPFEVAKREFFEETGFETNMVIKNSDFKELSLLKQPSGKRISAWAVEGDCDASLIESNTFTMEWPPKSGKQSEFPEVDRACWFSTKIAVSKLLKGQVGFIIELCNILDYDSSSEPEEQKDISTSKDTKKPKQLSLF